ncbi:hypothetical protein B0H14DRAFT_3727860 [Mycena olivaceomarginata]|nr:hypothetical protein B0H14DRAFT_3727860 [Mycena olivaceomarginata]
MLPFVPSHKTLVASIHAPLGLDPPFSCITSASRLKFKKYPFSMLFNRQSTEDRLRQMPRWHAQHPANILPVRSTEFARSLIYNVMLAAFVRVKEFMSKLWVSAWLEFQCEDLPAPYATEWPRSGRLDAVGTRAATPERTRVARRWREMAMDWGRVIARTRSAMSRRLPLTLQLRQAVGASPHFGPPGLGTGCRAAEGSMRRPALAPLSSCSTTAIARSPRTDSRVASQLVRARGAVGAVPGLQSPAPVALHAAAPPCPFAIVPPRRGRGHGNLDFLARAPATACARRMWATLYFHPLPPLVLLEAGPPRLPTTAAHHRAAAAGTHACGEPGLPCAHWRQRVRGRQEVLYSTSTHSLYRAGRRGGVDWSRNARRCVDGGRQGGRSGRAICAQWSVEGR